MAARETRILRLPEVARMTGLGKSTIHRRYRNGTFPQPLRLGERWIGWRGYSNESRHSRLAVRGSAMAGTIRPLVREA